MRSCFVFLNCALLVFRQTCEENCPILTTSLKSVALCCQVCSLFCIVARFFQENASKLSKISDGGNFSEASHEVESVSSATADNAVFPPNLLAEWQEFFSGSLFNTVLRLFMFHAGERRVGRLGPFQRRKRGGMMALLLSLLLLLLSFFGGEEGVGARGGGIRTCRDRIRTKLYLRTVYLCASRDFQLNVKARVLKSHFGRPVSASHLVKL